MYDESPGFFKKWLRIIVIQEYIEPANVSGGNNNKLMKL